MTAFLSWSKIATSQDTPRFVCSGLKHTERSLSKRAAIFDGGGKTVNFIITQYYIIPAKQNAICRFTTCGRTQLIIALCLGRYNRIWRNTTNISRSVLCLGFNVFFRLSTGYGKYKNRHLSKSSLVAFVLTSCLSYKKWCGNYINNW